MNRRKRKGWGRPFVMLDKVMLRSDEWKELATSSKIVYIYIKANYNGRNNGEISFKYSEMKRILASATIAKGLKQLEVRGWIKRTKYGGLFRYYNLYRLTGKYDRIR